MLARQMRYEALVGPVLEPLQLITRGRNQVRLPNRSQRRVVYLRLQESQSHLGLCQRFQSGDRFADGGDDVQCIEELPRPYWHELSCQDLRQRNLSDYLRIKCRLPILRFSALVSVISVKHNAAMALSPMGRCATSVIPFRGGAGVCGSIRHLRMPLFMLILRISREYRETKQK